MQQKMRKTLVILALLGTALLNYPRPGRGGTASGAYSQAAKNAYGGRDTAYPEYEETSREAPGKDYPKACVALGLSEDCTETMTKSQVRRAYHTWQLENHPDKTKRTQTSREIEEADKRQTAWKVLEKATYSKHAANNTAEDVRQEDIREERVPPTNSTAPA